MLDQLLLVGGAHESGVACAERSERAIDACQRGFRQFALGDIVKHSDQLRLVDDNRRHRGD
ncbi:MAG TPA: hypothetical protein VMV87_10615, partial [Burkholderiales bacterium]|nr:hypothetical protein [Burkholderiales bacterium]